MPTELHTLDFPPFQCLLSMPEGRPAEGGRFPLICFLHGYDEAAPTEVEEGLTRHGPLAEQSLAAGAGGFVVVAPQLGTAGDHWGRHADAVIELVESVQAAEPVDPQRCYLTGFSFGGNGVFDLALHRPEFWAALWAVDPTRAPERDPGLPVWLSSGEVSRRRAAAFSDVLHLQPPSTSPGQRVYEDGGLDHVGTAASAYADERIYDWLLRQRLRPDAGG